MTYRVPDQVPESGATSGANRGGTNPPTRPVPTRSTYGDLGLSSMAKSSNSSAVCNVREGI